MGIWEFMSSAAEGVQRNAPDTTSLRKAYNTAYGYGSAASTMIHQAVGDGLADLRIWMPDDEAKSKIARYASKFAQNAGNYALQEGYKLIPGGVAMSKIVSKTLEDVKYESLEAERLEALGVPSPQMSGGRKLIGESPAEDVIHEFMSKEFFGNGYFDAVIVTELANGKGKKPHH